MLSIPKLSKFPPLFSFVLQKSVYHFTVEMTTQLSDIDNFFLDIKNGRKPVSSQ